jgi:hypothetical protein
LGRRGRSSTPTHRHGRERIRPSTMLVLRSVTICATSHRDAPWPLRRETVVPSPTVPVSNVPSRIRPPRVEVSRGEVHSFQEMHRDDIGDKFGHLAEILEAIFDAGRAECDVRRVASHQVEVGVRREVAHSALRNRRNPAHRPRHHQGSSRADKSRVPATRPGRLRERNPAWRAGHL